MEKKNKKKQSKNKSSDSDKLKIQELNKKIEELNKKLEESEKIKKEYLAGWQRSRADLLNYKKEETERITSILKYANEDLILKILLILDNIYLAENKIPDNLKNNSWVKGILQIKAQILDLLKNQGVDEIKALGEKFNPNFHEAIEEIDVENKEQGVIIEEIQKGYKLNDKIIRPAKVRIVK